MPWDSNELTDAAQAHSPFVAARRDPTFSSEAPFAPKEDPLAASAVFAAPQSELATTDFEDEAVVDALPGYALEEALRPINEDELEEIPFASHEAESRVAYEDNEQPFIAAEEEAWLPKLGGLPARVVAQLNVVPGPQLAAAIAAGERDENKLTNIAFAERHPELPANHKIQPQEKGLAREWTEIRDKVIRPLLKTLGSIVRSKPYGGPYDPGYDPATPNAALKACLTVPANLRVAIVDITDPARPVYAGKNDDKTTFAASLAKVAAIYAAFELRARVNDALSDEPVVAKPVDLINKIAATWQPKMDALKPSEAKSYFPELAAIFDFKVVAGKWKADFTSKGDISTLGSGGDPEYATAVQLEGKFGFKELLQLTGRYSSDEATSRVVSALGYQYIHGALVSAGFYKPGAGGIWLSASYPHAPGYSTRRDEVWPVEPTIVESNGMRRFQVGTPETFARLFTLMAQGKLPGSSEMMAIFVTMNTDFIKNALVAGGRAVTDSRTKVGVIKASYWCQTSIISRGGPRPFTYVISVMNNTAPFLLNAATIGPLDQCILTRHP